MFNTTFAFSANIESSITARKKIMYTSHFLTAKSQEEDEQKGGLIIPTSTSNTFRSIF